MKRKSLLLSIIITFLLVVFLSWVIPAGSYNYGEFTKGDITAVGLFDLITYPINAFNYFAKYGVLLLVIGGTYGVLNKTGAYSKIINRIVNKFKKDEKLCLVGIAALFAILSSLTDLQMLLFALVPFFATIIILLGYKKITALVATVGAILIGGIGAIASSEIRYVVNYYVNNYGFDPVNSLMLPKTILTILLTGALVAYLWFKAEKEVSEEQNVVVTKKKTTKKEETISENKPKTILFSNHEEEGKSTLPIIVISIIVLLVALIGMINWSDIFEIQIFTNLYDSMSKFTVFGFPLFKNLMGNLPALGYWGTSELAGLLILASLLIGWLYNLKLKGTMAAFIEGAKEMLPTAIYATLAYVVFNVFASNQNGASPLFTIINKLAGSSSELEIGNLFRMIGISSFGSLYINDVIYYFNNIFTVTSTLYDSTAMYSFAVYICQTVYSLLMMVLPTSIVLIAGLSYFEVSYKEWFKKNWLLLLIVAGITLAMMFVVFIFLH